MGRGGEEGQRKMGGARGETNLGKATEKTAWKKQNGGQESAETKEQREGKKVKEKARGYLLLYAFTAFLIKNSLSNVLCNPDSWW